MSVSCVQVHKLCRCPGYSNTGCRVQCLLVSAATGRLLVGGRQGKERREKVVKDREIERKSGRGRERERERERERRGWWVFVF